MYARKHFRLPTQVPGVPQKDQRAALSQLLGLYKQLEPHMADAVRKAIEWRRSFHMYPEVSYEEEQTSAKMRQILSELGLRFVPNLPGHGFAAILDGEAAVNQALIAVRAEMDGLRLSGSEQVAVDFRSRVDKVMACCGHDVHMGAALALAFVLSQVQDILPGSLMIIGESGEESNDNTEQFGPPAMIRAGFFAEEQPHAVYAVHVLSQLESGKIEYSDNRVLHATDMFKVLAKGKAVHAAIPWKGVSAQDMLADIHTLYRGRSVPELQPIDVRHGLDDLREEDIPGALVSTTYALAGEEGVTGVLPEHGEMMGTVRSLTPETREQVMAQMQQIVAAVAERYGGEAAVEFQQGYDAIANSTRLHRLHRPVLAEVLDESNVSTHHPYTFADTFGIYGKPLQGNSGLIFVVGTPAGHADPGQHNSRFYVDEEVTITTAITVLLTVTLNDMVRLQFSED